MLDSSNGVINELNSLEVENCKYGSLKVNTLIGNIKTNSEYLILNIQNASGKEMDIKSEYGAVNIKNWDFENSNFEITQAKLDLGYSKTSFKFNLNINSCASFTDSVLNTLPTEIKKKLTGGGKKHRYTSYFLNKNSKNNLTVTMRKGILRFNKIEMPLAVN